MCRETDISVPLADLNEELIVELSSLLRKQPGSVELYFKVHDVENHMSVDLLSHGLKIGVHKELMAYLKGKPCLEYKIN